LRCPGLEKTELRAPFRHPFGLSHCGFHILLMSGTDESLRDSPGARAKDQKPRCVACFRTHLHDQA
jgi:hypothetical protein